MPKLSKKSKDKIKNAVANRVQELAVKLDPAFGDFENEIPDLWDDNQKEMFDDLHTAEFDICKDIDDLFD